MPQILQHLELVEPVLPGVVIGHLLSETVAAGEGAGEDDAGFVAHRHGQQPAVGQEFAGGGGLEGLHEGDAGFAQGVESGGHRQLSGGVEGFDQLAGHTVFSLEIERPRSPGQLDHLVRVSDDLEAAAAVVGLDHAGDALVLDAMAEAFGDEVDELLAAQDAQGIVRVHHRFFGAGQAQSGARDHDRAEGGIVAVEWLCRACCVLRAGQSQLQGLRQLTKGRGLLAQWCLRQLTK